MLHTSDKLQTLVLSLWHDNYNSVTFGFTLKNQPRLKGRIK